jgi:hypothetical protein
MWELDEKEKKRLFEDWHALREACNMYHKPGIGGAAMCICGAGGGGSKACSMLKVIKSIIMYGNQEAVLKALKEIV